MRAILRLSASRNRCWKQAVIDDEGHGAMDQLSGMNAQDWITLIAFGGIVGMIGQGIRAATGLKKLHDKAQQEGKVFSEVFQTNTLVISLFIGFIAGALGAISLRGAGQLDIKSVAGQTLIALLGIGYAGTDFIEAFIRKTLPGASEPSGNSTAQDKKSSPTGPSVEPTASEERSAFRP